MKWILFYFYLEATGCAPFLAKSAANELNAGIDIAEKRSWIQCG